MTKTTTPADDGGPAFPPVHDPHTHQSGMSLRDYFAAKVMQGFCADHTRDQMGSGKLMARYAYEIADAMLKERQQ